MRVYVAFEEKRCKVRTLGERKLSLVTNITIPPSLTAPPRLTARILIVDNDEEILMNLERVLEDQSYATETAINYEQASMLLSRRPFDLLVLDDHLSDRDSIEVVVDLRCSDLVPPFIVVTYHKRPSRGEQARLWILGVSALINKLAHDELAQTVRAMLDSCEHGPSL